MRSATARQTARDLLRLPNLLSLSRIAMAGLVWIAPRNLAFLLALIAAAGITDLLDGWSARVLARRKSEPFDPTGMGAWLDPLCDKIFVVSAVVAVVVAWDPRPGVVALILLRDLLQVPLLLVFLALFGRSVRVDYRAAKPGKLTTVAQFAALLSILLLPAAVVPLAWLSAGLGVVAVLVLVQRGITAARAQGALRPPLRALRPRAAARHGAP